VPATRTERQSLAAWLHTRRHVDGGWPYYAGRRSRLEPTCWAALALGVSAHETPVPGWPRTSGLIIEPATGVPNLAFNGVAAALLSPPVTPSVPDADLIDALLRTRGVTLPPEPAVAQDQSLQAWPWMPGTFSWVEPTAWCLLAVKRSPEARRSARGRMRIEEAERLLADRACPGGGWNFGNGALLGQTLPAHVPTTALALIALQDLGTLPVVRAGTEWLERHAAGEGAGGSLALAWLALRVLGRDTRPLEPALEAACEDAPRFGNVATAAMLLYALDCATHDTEPAALTVS